MSIMRLALIFRKHKSFLITTSRFLGYFLLLFGLCYQIQRLYKKLKVEPEIFSKETSIQSSKIPFPAVTYCPPFSVKTEAWTSNYSNYNNLTVNDVRAAMLQTCPGDHDMYMEYIKHPQPNMDNFINILSKSATDVEEMMNYCGINEYYADFKDCAKLFVKSVTDYGVCYTFNMLGHRSIFNSETSINSDTFKRTKITKTWNPEEVLDESRHENDTEPPKWSLESGYLNDKEHIQPARALRMQTLTFETKSLVNQSLCEGREKNFKIILHLPNEIPKISHESIDIPLGKIESLAISAEMIKNEDSLRNFQPETRGCYFEDEKQLKFFKSYTKSNCEYECVANLTYESCGCVKFSMPRTNKMEICDYDKDNCHRVILRTFPRSYYKDERSKIEHPNFPCGCLPSCTELKYKIIKVERKSSEHSELHLLTNVKIIFIDSQIHVTSNYVTYEMENFIFDIGGLIGLFLGSSILSVLETVVSICLTIKNRCKKMINWFQRKIRQESESSSPMEPQQPNRFETVLDIPLDEIESIESAEESQAETLNENPGIITISVEDLN